MIRYEFLQDEMQQTYVLPNRTRPFSSMALQKKRRRKLHSGLQKRRLETALNVANRGTSIASLSILHKNTGGNAQSTSCEYSG